MSDGAPPWAISTALGETRDGLSFIDVLARCAADPDFVAGHSRIMKVPVPAAGGVAHMIDEASGLDRDWAHSFASFVWETVWTRFAPPDDRPGVTIHRCLKGCGWPSVGVCERCRAIPQGEEGRGDEDET